MYRKMNSQSKKCNKKRVPCVFQGCTMTFSSKFGMERHQVTHQVTKGYTCQYCKRQFALPQYLKDHINLHTGEKPYVCSVPGCDAKFKQSSSLSNHKKNVHRQNAKNLPNSSQNKRLVKKTRKYEESVTYESESSSSFSEDLTSNHSEASFVVDYSRPMHPLVQSLRVFGPVFRYEQSHQGVNFDKQEMNKIQNKVQRLQEP